MIELAEDGDFDSACPDCGHDGGTSCGLPNCGLLVSRDDRVTEIEFKKPDDTEGGTCD